MHISFKTYKGYKIFCWPGFPIFFKQPMGLPRPNEFEQPSVHRCPGDFATSSLFSISRGHAYSGVLLTPEGNICVVSLSITWYLSKHNI